MCNFFFRRTPFWSWHILLNLGAEDKNASSHYLRGEMTSAGQMRHSLSSCTNYASGFGLRNIIF